MFGLLAPANLYYMSGPLHPWRYITALGLTLGLTCAFVCCSRIASRWSRVRPVFAAAEVACVIGVANNVRLGIVDALGLSGQDTGSAIAAGLLIAALALGLLGGTARFIKGARWGLLCLAPFAVLVSIQALARVASYERDLRGFQTPVAFDGGDRTPPRRLVVLVFDELDYEAVFDKRQPGVELPEIDQLAGESWVAQRAFPLSNTTICSVPAIVSGLSVMGPCLPMGPGSLSVRVRGESSGRDWKALPSVFADAQGRGTRTAVIGWYHPYCRVFGRLLSHCTQELTAVEPATLTGNLWVHYFELSGTLVVARDRFKGTGTAPEQHVHQYQSIHRQAVTAALRPDLGFVYVHYPVPHHPYVYSRRTRTLATTGGQQYIDNVALVDRTIGDVRRAIRASPVATTTGLVVTSDHSNKFGATRKSWTTDTADPAHRVPFLLHLPGARAPHLSSELIELTALRRIATAYFEGRISTYADVQAVALSAP